MLKSRPHNELWHMGLFFGQCVCVCARYLASRLECRFHSKTPTIATTVDDR
jgi:hypothetical protein